MVASGPASPICIGLVAVLEENDAGLAPQYGAVGNAIGVGLWWAELAFFRQPVRQRFCASSVPVGTEWAEVIGRRVDR